MFKNIVRKTEETADQFAELRRIAVLATEDLNQLPEGADKDIH